MVARDEVALDRLVGACIDQQSAAVGTQHDEDAFDVVAAHLRAGHVGVAQEVVEPVGIHLARDDVAAEPGGGAANEVDNTLRQGRVYLPENLVRLTLRMQQQLRREVFMVEAEDTLHDMAEGGVADVVQERRCYGRNAVERLHLIAEGVADAAGHMCHPHRVGKTGMLGAMKDEVCQSELPHGAEPLHLGGVDETDDERPEDSLITVVDDVVNRVAKDLAERSGPSHEILRRGWTPLPHFWRP